MTLRRNHTPKARLIAYVLGEGAKPNRLVILCACTIALLGLAIRIALLVISAGHTISPVSGVADQERYLTLAESIFQGRGFTYFDQPTALRPPIYPFLLAGFHLSFGVHYLLAIRIFQFLLGIAVAYVCLLIARSLFGNESGAIAGPIALALPTLVYVGTEIQTEQLATFLTVLFLFFLVVEFQRKTNYVVGMGITSGLAMLVRFNCAILVVIAVIVCIWTRRNPKDVIKICLISGLVITPWIVRNAVEFRGKILFSSHGGINFLEGVVSPFGRAQPGESERVRATVGWLHTDIEVNNPHRLLFPDEAELDMQAKAAAIVTWKHLDWRSRFTLLGRKIIVFWLSTEQVEDTTSFSPTQRRLRIAGVLVYWTVLTFAFIGWLRLCSRSRVAATIVAFYTVFVTSAHLPFVMNTRIRIPLLDPLLSILAAGGLLACCGHVAATLQTSKYRFPGRRIVGTENKLC